MEYLKSIEKTYNQNKKELNNLEKEIKKLTAQTSAYKTSIGHLDNQIKDSKKSIKEETIELDKINLQKKIYSTSSKIQKK